MPDENVRVIIRGALLEGKAPAIMEEAERGSIADLVKEGEAKAQSVLKPGKGVLTGHYQSSIHGAVVSSKHGEIKDGGVEYGSWLETGKRRGQKTRFKGLHTFRKTRAHLRRVANEIAGRQYSRAVKRLT